MTGDYRGFYPQVKWLLPNIAPKHVQLEALSRSMLGQQVCRHRFDAPDVKTIGRHGAAVGPASGWAHFMRMRLGKTYVALAEFLWLREDFGVTNMLVFSPNKYKEAWKLEAETSGVMSPVHVFKPDRNKAVEKFIDDHPDGVMVVNYEALIQPRNLLLIQKFVNANTFIVCDESIMIKNRSTSFFKGVHSFTKQVRYKRILTGSPIAHGPQDVYSQLRAIGALEGVNFYSFRNRFCVMGGFAGRQIVGSRNPEALGALLQQHSFVAKRPDWVDDFEPDYFTRDTPLVGEQYSHYKTMAEEFVTYINNVPGITASQVISQYEKLSQISSGFVIDDTGDAHALLPFDRVPKIADALWLLENEIDCKVIMVAHHAYVVEQLMVATKKHSPALIGGGATMKKLNLDVETEKHRFNNDPDCRVMVAQGQAVKYGHTLVGTKFDPCEVTMFIENNYSLDTREQTEQRNISQQQDRPMVVIDFVSSSIEARIIKALQRKESVARAILSYATGSDESTTFTD